MFDRDYMRQAIEASINAPMITFAPRKGEGQYSTVYAMWRRSKYIPAGPHKNVTETRESQRRARRMK